MPLREVNKTWLVGIIFAVVIVTIIAIVLWKFAPAGWVPGANIFMLIKSGLTALADLFGVTIDCAKYSTVGDCQARSGCTWDTSVGACKRSQA